MYFPNRLGALKRHVSTGVLAALAALFLAILGSFLGMFSRAELSLGDWVSTFATTTSSQKTVIVGIDQQTLAHYGGWPLDRSHMANVLNILRDAGANRIFVDSTMATESRPESDASLEESLRKLGPNKVALPVSVLRGKPGPDGQCQPVFIESLKRFTQHTTIVSADMPFDSDGRVRSLGRTALGEVAAHPTAASWLASGHLAQPGDSQVNYGVDLKTIPVLSFMDVELKEGTASAALGKNVVIGMVAERVSTPVFVPRYGEIQRAEFLALATESLLLKTPFTSAPMWLTIAIAAVIVMTLGSWLPRVGMAPGGAVTLLALVVQFFVGVELQRRTGMSLALGVPFAAIILTFAGTLIATHPSFQNTRHALLSLVDKVDYGLAKLFHSGVDAIITFTPDGKILTVNETAEKLFGVKAKAVIGLPLSTVLPDEADSLLRSASGHQPGRLVAKVADTTGQDRHVDLAFNAIPSESGWVGYASIRDITDMKAREEHLKHQTTHDAMTSLPNRAAFERHLDASICFAATTHRPFAVFLIDLNKFKQVNDTLGHHIGDLLLIEVARRFKNTIRPSDFVARLGGDEFAVVIAPPTDQSSAEEMAARLVDSVAKLTELDGHAIETGASIGIALYPEHAKSSAELMRMADQAMYSSKRGNYGYEVAAKEALELAPC